MDSLKRKFENPTTTDLPPEDTTDDNDSISSAEKEVRLRQERRQRKKVKAARVPIAAIISADELKSFQVQEDTNGATLSEFTVLPLEDIVKTHPELGDTTKRSKLQYRAQSTNDMPKDSEHPNPPLTGVVTDFIRNLPRPEYVDLMHQGVSQHTHIERIHQRIVMLPIQRAALESALLAQAGVFSVTMQDKGQRSYNFPPCMRGPKCEGVTAQLPGFTSTTPGVVLTSFMFQHEYDAFLETGMPVSQPRCCVLCMRAAFADFVLLTRNNCNSRLSQPANFSFQVYRNLMDEPGGYYQAYLWTPFRREEGFADCMAIFTRSALRAYQDPQQSNRWVIDQSCMVYQPPSPLPYIANETVEDFLQRVEKFEGIHASSDWTCTQTQIKAHDPFLFLTRYFETFSHPEAAEWILGRAYWTSPLEIRSQQAAIKAHQQLICIQKCKTLPCEVREAACQAIDLNSALIRSDYTEADRAFLSVQWFHPNTFPFHVAPHVRQVCFWEQLRFSYVSPLAHLLGKSSNQPCQTRKFSSIVKRFARNSPFNHKFLRIVVVTNLIGNYPGVTENCRLRLEWRTHLRMVHHRSPAVWDAFISENPQVLLFSMRMMLVWFVRDDPMLFRHVCHLGAWQEFEAVVIFTCQRMRDLIQGETQPPHSHWTTLFSDSTTRSLNQMCNEAHPDILATCYQRQRTGLLHFIHTCTQRSVGGIHNVVSQETHNTLRRLILSLDTREHSIQDSVLPLLPHFGVPRSALEFITRVSDDYERMRLGKRALRCKLNAFQQQFPYSFEILQIVSSEWKRQGSRFLVHIPSHYIRAQLRALSERSITSKLCQAIPLQLLHTYYCQSCSRIASIIRAPPPTYYAQSNDKQAPSQYTDQSLSERRECELHQTFTRIHERLGPPVSGNNIFRGNISTHQRRAMESVVVGYAECIVDMFDNSVYCKNNRAQRITSCFSQPLSRAFMLGFAWWNNGWMLLCPHCCVLFVYVPHQCTYTVDGFVCHMCTKRTHAQRIRQFNPLLPQITRNTELKCSLCCQSIVSHKNAILMPYGAVMCKRHNTQRMKLITRSAHIMTKKQIEDAIVEEYQVNTKYWREKKHGAMKTKHRNPIARSSYFQDG